MEELVKVEKIMIEFTPNNIKALINEKESGAYSSEDENGNFVIVVVTQGEKIVLHTHQANDWVRWNEYDKDGYCIGEGYGR